MRVPLAVIGSLVMLGLNVATSRAQDPVPDYIGSIIAMDPAFPELVSRGTEIEVLAGGFEWSEGPVWVPDGPHLLFSDIPNNRINKWRPEDGISVFLEPSGYTGTEPFEGSEPGTNGLMLDSEGRLVMCCHGDRLVKRMERDGSFTVLASHYEGKRLNSPNDLVYHSSGDLYFTDPPYGLPRRYEDAARELDFCGVYRLQPDGTLTLVTREMTRPNGIALSPDEKTLYVAQSDPEAAIWKAFPVQDDGTLGPGRVIQDQTEYVGERPGLPDGMAVDRHGNLWATGPGGVLVMDADGKLLGRLDTTQRTANCTFGGDGRSLYVTADMFLCRVRTNVQGLGFE